MIFGRLSSLKASFCIFLVLLLDHVDKDKDKDYCHDEEDLLRDNMESTKAAENTEKIRQHESDHFNQTFPRWEIP